MPVPRIRLSLRSSGLLALLLLAVSSGATAASFTPLGDLPGGEFQSFAFAISDDGSTVVGGSRVAGPAPGRNASFRWTAAGGIEDLGALPGGNSGVALGVNGDGTVVVGEGSTGTGSRAYRWTAASGQKTGLGELSTGPTLTFSRAQAVDGSGDVVVGDGNTSAGAFGFAWTSAGGLMESPDLEFVSDISPEASVLVGRTSTGVAGRQFVGGAVEPLGVLPGGSSSRASAVSASGDVVAGSSSSSIGTQPFRWTASGGLVGLGFVDPEDRFATTWDISTEGTVIVGESFGGSARRAFVWTEALGVVSLQVLLTSLGVDLSGWQLQVASGVASDGVTISGYGLNPDGNVEAFLAVIPEPSTALLTGLGLVLLARRR